jgi:hypothetical protein
LEKVLPIGKLAKLVPQDPTDESASTLLQRIRDERVESAKKIAAERQQKMRGQP